MSFGTVGKEKLKIKRGDTVERHFDTVLPDEGILHVRVSTFSDTLTREQCDQVAKDLRELADVFAKLEAP